MATNDFLVIAPGPTPNVASQATYAADPIVTTGNLSGVAKSAIINKGMRQSSILAAVLAQLIVDNTGQNAVDDGTTTTLLANLKTAISGRFTGTQVFTASGTYTPTVGTKRIRVTVVGAGGGAGGSAAVAVGQGACGVSGGGGGFAIGILTSGFSGVSVVVGTGGTGATGNNAGSAGGASSFLTLSGGGGGGGPGSASVGVPTATGSAGGGVGAGGSIINGIGTASNCGVIVSTTAVVAGLSGTSLFAGGRSNATITTQVNGAPGGAAGAGGAGGVGGGPAGGSAAATGGNGANGIVIIEEFA